MSEVITLDPLSEAQIGALKKKLNEYKERRMFKAPEVSQDTWYKEVILAELLREGSVNPQELWKRDIDGLSWVDKSDYMESAKVIRDYVETGGKNAWKEGKPAPLTWHGPDGDLYWDLR